jgi:hypothetical protein
MITHLFVNQSILATSLGEAAQGYGVLAGRSALYRVWA